MAEAYVGDYGDGEFGYVFHLVFDEVLELFGFGGDDVEEEFVVDLEGHGRTGAVASPARALVRRLAQ